MGSRRKWKKEDSIQWVIDQYGSVIQDVKPNGCSTINYDKNLGDKHLVWCSKCGHVYDRVYGDIYPDFPKLGKEKKDHAKQCSWFSPRRN